MARTSRIKAVWDYLEEEITISQCILLDAIKDEDFVKAGWVREFKVKLEKALSLCGESMPKSRLNYIRNGNNDVFIPPNEPTVPGITPNRGED